MAHLRVLDLAKPFISVLPEVEAPYQKTDVQERALWSTGIAILYLIMTELPLYGVKDVLTLPDSISSLRPLLAASNGTPVEFGVIPILIAGFCLQIKAAKRSLNVSLDLRSERVLFQSAQKLLALAIGFLLSFLVVACGAYGSVSSLGYTAAIMLVVQLSVGNLMVVLFDEIIAKNYGFGTGVLIFTTVSAAQKFAWSLLAIQRIDTAAGSQFFGALPNLFQKITTRSLSFAIVNSVFRDNLPSIVDALTAVFAFCGALYLSSVRQDIQIRSTKVRAASSSFPLRLLYTGALPILNWAALLATVRVVSAAIYRAAPENVVIRLVGTWKQFNHEFVPVSGLASYLNPGNSFADNLKSPIASVVYVLFTLFSFSHFNLQWIRASGFDAVDIAKQFKEQSIVILGKRDSSALKELRQLLPTVAVTSGVVLGGFVAGLDVVGATGWGSAMCLAVGNIMTVFEQLAQEGYNAGL